MRGSIRRKSDGAELECVAKFRGSLGTMTPDEFLAQLEQEHKVKPDVKFARSIGF